MIAALVYLLCAMTSVICTWLLLMQYRRSRVPLLFWSSLCFIGLTLNNVILFVDLVLMTQIDLSLLRTIPALAGVMLIIWGVYLGHGMSQLYWTISGAIMLGSWVAGTFFFKFWSKTKDRLFLLFGVAFWVFAIERLVLALVNRQSEEGNAVIYLLRLLAFALIIAAIVDKNRQERR